MSLGYMINLPCTVQSTPSGLLASDWGTGKETYQPQFCLSAQDSDSTGTKFEGALINALIFVVIVGVMTFVLFLLFKYKVRAKGRTSSLPTRPCMGARTAIWKPKICS